jgi:hypothetical protein
MDHHKFTQTLLYPPDTLSKAHPFLLGAAAAPGLIVKTGYLGFLWFFSVAENIFLGDTN